MDAKTLVNFCCKLFCETQIEVIKSFEITFAPNRVYLFSRLVYFWMKLKLFFRRIYILRIKFNLVKNIWQYLLAYIKKRRLKSTKMEWNITAFTRFDGTYLLLTSVHKPHLDFVALQSKRISKCGLCSL